MGDMMSQRYPCRCVAPWAACAHEPLVVAASGERWMRARGCNSGAPGEETLPWSAQVEMLSSWLDPRMTCCIPGGCRVCWGGWSSGILREQRCGWWLSAVSQSWRVVCRWGHGSEQHVGHWRPGCSPWCVFAPGHWRPFFELLSGRADCAFYSGLPLVRSGCWLSSRCLGKMPLGFPRPPLGPARQAPALPQRTLILQHCCSSLCQ